MSHDRNAVRKILPIMPGPRAASIDGNPRRAVFASAYGITIPKKGVATSARRGSEAGRKHRLFRV